MKLQGQDLVLILSPSISAQKKYRGVPGRYSMTEVRRTERPTCPHHGCTHPAKMHVMWGTIKRLLRPAIPCPHLSITTAIGTMIVIESVKGYEPGNALTSRKMFKGATTGQWIQCLPTTFVEDMRNGSANHLQNLVQCKPPYLLCRVRTQGLRIRYRLPLQPRLQLVIMIDPLPHISPRVIPGGILTLDETLTLDRHRRLLLGQRGEKRKPIMLHQNAHLYASLVEEEALPQVRTASQLVRRERSHLRSLLL